MVFFDRVHPRVTSLGKDLVLVVEGRTTALSSRRFPSRGHLLEDCFPLRAFRKLGLHIIGVGSWQTGVARVLRDGLHGNAVMMSDGLVVARLW
jgi:hypothetical protein